MNEAQEWLLERLKDHGVDVYASGPFETLLARLGHAIVANQLNTAIIGRSAGKPETYQQFFERVFGEKLPDVPRGTISNAERS